MSSPIVSIKLTATGDVVTMPRELLSAHSDFFNGLDTLGSGATQYNGTVKLDYTSRETWDLYAAYVQESTTADDFKIIAEEDFDRLIDYCKLGLRIDDRGFFNLMAQAVIEESKRRVDATAEMSDAIRSQIAAMRQGHSPNVTSARTAPPSDEGVDEQ